MAVDHGAVAVVGLLQIAEVAKEDCLGAGGFSDDFIHARVGCGVVTNDVAGEHESTAIEAVNEVEALVSDDASEEVAGEVAAFDLKAEAMANEAIETAKADGVTETGIEHPKQVAVLVGVIVFVITAEADGIAHFSKEPFGQFAGVHFASIIKSFFCEGVEARGEIGGLHFPASEEGRDLGEAFFELSGGLIEPAPAHPRIEKFIAANGFEHARNQAIFFDGQWPIQFGHVQRQVFAHNGELFLHSAADHF